MSVITTATLLPEVIVGQMGYIKECLADLEAKRFLDEIGSREYTTQSEELWEQYTQLEAQLANW